ncbi:MAG: preprotein translocase subunit SecE [Candidatus Saccharibacteria bacterium]|nr:preprotein translocase subunit SecE [Candidatus Saccharibacteria bacterium]
MPQTKGHRRNLKTVREVAKNKRQSSQKPAWFKRFLKGFFSPLLKLLTWLNQPLATHQQVASSNWTIAWTKQRSMMPKYFRQSFAEIKLVTWPTFPVAMRLTFAVVIFTCIFAGLIAGLDWVLSKIFEEIIINEGQNLKNLF